MALVPVVNNHGANQAVFQEVAAGWPQCYPYRHGQRHYSFLDGRRGDLPVRGARSITPRLFGDDSSCCNTVKTRPWSVR
jgi:hypothetical protein